MTRLWGKPVWGGGGGGGGGGGAQSQVCHSRRRRLSTRPPRQLQCMSLYSLTVCMYCNLFDSRLHPSTTGGSLPSVLQFSLPFAVLDHVTRVLFTQQCHLSSDDSSSNRSYALCYLPFLWFMYCPSFGRCLQARLLPFCLGDVFSYVSHFDSLSNDGEKIFSLLFDI